MLPMTVPLARPPEATNSSPALRMVPLAMPPALTVFEAAQQDGRADGATAGKDVFVAGADNRCDRRAATADVLNAANKSVAGGGADYGLHTTHD